MAEKVNDSQEMICPVCGKSLLSLKSFSDHVARHYEDEKKQKAEDDKKNKEEQRKKDIDNLLQLNAEYKAAERKFEAALSEYRNKYNGYIFPFSKDMDYILNLLF